VDLAGHLLDQHPHRLIALVLIAISKPANESRSAPMDYGAWRSSWAASG